MKIYTKDKVSLRHLVCFLEVTRLSSVSRAALSLNLAQSAVSRTLAELENNIGMKLLDRSRRGSYLTSFGREFHDLVVPGLAYLQQAYALTDPDSDAQRIVRFGAVSSTLVKSMPNILHQFQAANRSVTVRVVEDRNVPLLRLLRAGELDVVLGRLISTEQIQGLAFEHLADEAIICAVRANHPLLNRPGVPLRELRDWPVIINLPETMARAELGRLMLAQDGEVPKCLIETNSTSLPKTMVLDGDPIWITPEGSVAPEIATGQIRVLDVIGWGLERPLGLWSNPKVKAAGVTREFINEVRKHIHNASVM